MSISASSTSQELFEHFRPRYEEVELLPLNLVHNHHAYAHETANHFYFNIGRNGEKISSVFFPTLDLIEAGVKFNFSFDGTKKPESLWWDLNRTIGLAIRMQLFEGRRFTLRPKNLERVFDHSRGTEVLLAVDGPPIPGLDLAVKNKTMTWELFIPRYSPEGRVIQERSRLEAVEAAMKIPRDLPETVAQARTRVELALSQVVL